MRLHAVERDEAPRFRFRFRFRFVDRDEAVQVPSFHDFDSRGAKPIVMSFHDFRPLAYCFAADRNWVPFSLDNITG